MSVREETYCRVCNGKLEIVHDFGNIYPSGFCEKGLENTTDRVPIILSRCTECGLVQLKHTVDLDLMYRQYWYSSSLNRSMVSSLKDVVNHAESVVNLCDDDTVVDIGCNDGTLLNLYSKKNLITIGYDPALNLKPDCSYFYNDYFSVSKYFDVYGHVKAKVITAIAMFYDLPDPNKFINDVKSILRDDGIFIVQFTDLVSMIKATAFDNICHEHLEYYRLQDIVSLFKNNGMDVIDVSYNDVNGGSLRTVISHSGNMPISNRVQEYLEAEKDFLSTSPIETFVGKVEIVKDNITMFLKLMKHTNKTVALLGASTKGNTLLQVCGVSSDDIKYAAEVNRDKFGLVTVGSGIEIADEAFILNEIKPDYLLVPIWHFKESLIRKDNILKYINGGGKLVFPLPRFQLIGKEDL
jgi:SAM-dependent methyltransferase